MTDWLSTERPFAQGAFGKVYLVAPDSVAKHVGRANYADYGEYVLDIRNEAALLDKLRGKPNVIQKLFYQEIVRGEKIEEAVFGFPFYKSSVRHLVNNAGKSTPTILYWLWNVQNSPLFDRTTRIDLARQMCTGVKSCHDAGIVHRDIKTDNMMINERGGWLSTSYDLVLIDFGLSKWIHEETAGRKKQRRVDREVSRYVGTESYIPPEYMRGVKGDTSKSADIWSLGAAICELYMYEYLFKDYKEGQIRFYLFATAYLLADGDDAKQKAKGELEVIGERLDKQWKAKTPKEKKETVLYDQPSVHRKWLGEWDDIYRKCENKLKHIQQRMEGDGIWDIWRAMMSIDFNTRPTIDKVLDNLC
jgi:serine/threonine protein kinase